jgi:hypothetical protein
MPSLVSTNRAPMVKVLAHFLPSGTVADMVAPEADWP